MHKFISNNITIALCILLQSSNLSRCYLFILIVVHEVIVQEMGPKTLNTGTLQPTNVLAIILTLLIACFVPLAYKHRLMS